VNINDIKQQINTNHITVLESLIKLSKDRRKLIIDFLAQHDISIDSAIDCLNMEKMIIQERQQSNFQRLFLEQIHKEDDKK
jgi:hypothetical protein